MANTTPISKIRGMTDAMAQKLQAHQISNSESLLKAGASPEARRELAKKLDTSEKALLEFLNRADLDRVAGIGAAYSNLLEEAGVDTVKELSKRVPENLYNKIGEINTAKKITTHPPTMHMVEEWVKEAKVLPVVLEY